MDSEKARTIAIKICEVVCAPQKYVKPISDEIEAYAESRVREAQTEMYWQPRETVERNARAEGYKAGQEAMRERAAKCCDNDYYTAGGVIRSLPIEEKA